MSGCWELQILTLLSGQGCECTRSVSVCTHAFCDCMYAHLLWLCECTRSVTVCMHTFCDCVYAHVLWLCVCTPSVIVWMHTFCDCMYAHLLWQYACTPSVTVCMHTFCDLSSWVFLPNNLYFECVSMYVCMCDVVQKSMYLSVWVWPRNSVLYCPWVAVSRVAVLSMITWVAVLFHE